MVSKHRDLIVRIAATYALDPRLLEAQVWTESSDDPFAFRHEKGFFERYLRHHPDAKGFAWGPLAACSYGLLQILGETALELGYDDRPERLFIPQVSLSWGAKYLVRCRERAHGDPRGMLARYNGTGPAAEAYAEKVLHTVRLLS